MGGRRDGGEKGADAASICGRGRETEHLRFTARKEWPSLNSEGEGLVRSPAWRDMAFGEIPPPPVGC